MNNLICKTILSFQFLKILTLICNQSACDSSIAENLKFGYDCSILEADRRSPAPSPSEASGGMPNQWDYRIRFCIAAITTFFTSFYMQQIQDVMVLIVIHIVQLLFRIKGAEAATSIVILLKTNKMVSVL